MRVWPSSTSYLKRSFIKEKGFHYLEDFFQKTISNNEWIALCQPLRPIAMMVVHKFYSNLATNV